MLFAAGAAEPSAAGEAIEAALRNPSTVALVRAYAAISDASMRRSFLQLVRTVAGKSPEQTGSGEGGNRVQGAQGGSGERFRSACRPDAG